MNLFKHRIKISSAEKQNRISTVNLRIRRKSRKNGKVAASLPVVMTKKQLLLDNEKEYFELVRLEKNLKLKTKPALTSKSFCDDGLDYILATCDKKLTKPNNVSGDETRKNIRNYRAKINKHKATKEGRFGGLSKVHSNDCMSAEEIYESGIDKLNGKEIQENGNSIGKSHLMETILADSCSDVELKRKLKGLLNRLTEANMQKIVMQLEDLYSSNSHHYVSKVLLEALMISIASYVRTPEQLIQESALLIGILHAIADMSVGAMVVHTAVMEFHICYRENSDEESKKLDNLVLFISHLYNFKVVDDILIFDVLNVLTGRFYEKDIELILSILRIVGIDLRKTSSLQWKELMLELQKKANDAREKEMGCRVKYMLDVVVAINYNNIQKIPNYDPDRIERLKKVMKGFIPPGRSVTQIKISLEDIIRGEKHGHLLKSLASGDISELKDQPPANVSNEWQPESLAKLLKKNRMNTDVRRKIFSIVVTAEDYLDAFQKLLHLNVKDDLDDEIMNLIVHCALQGKTYNRYYQFLACKLSLFNRKYMLALQHSVWHKMDDLNSLKGQQVNNLAKFVSDCIIESGLPLTSLKVLDFSMIDQHMTAFLKDILINILKNSSDEHFEIICKRSTSSKHAFFRESVWLYAKHILCSSDVEEKYGDINYLRQKLEIMYRIFVGVN